MATKSAKKSEVVNYVTPFFAARYPKISKPDTEGKYADGKFKTDGLFLSDADYEAALAAAQAAAKKLWPNVPVGDVVLPIKEFFNKGEGDAKVSAGMGLTLKSKYRPAVFDARKKKLPENASIGGGSEIRVASAFFSWEKTAEETIVENGVKRKEKVTQYGISLRLGDTQVRVLSEGSGQGDGAAFEEVEGFEYDGESADTSSFDNDATKL